jgi:predicted Zn finger-like uncharacterized protein
MSLNLHCPLCWHKYAVEDSAAGREVRCPSCHATTVAPARPKPVSDVGSTSRLRVRPIPQHTAPPAPSPAPTPAAAPEPPAAVCRRCGQALVLRLPCRDCAAVLCSERCLDEHRRGSHRKTADGHVAKLALTFALGGVPLPVLLPIALVLSIVALARGERGEAVGALVLSLVLLPLWIVVGPLLVSALFSRRA